MPQILKGDTFADGQQVTGARLNQLIDSAQLLVGSITDQTAIAAGTVEAADQLNINDNSASALRKATVGDILGSNIPIVTSAITAGNSNDITTTPNDATTVTGSTYTSADGLTVVVTTPAAHGLSVGQVVLISGAGSGYNGTFQLTVASGSSFTYVMLVAATAGSGSLSYTKKGTSKVSGNFAVTGNGYVDGSLSVTGSATFAGGISGNITLNGNITIGAGKTLTLDSAPTANLHAATKAYVDGFNYIKAYAKVSGTTINAQLNIASVTNPSTGVYTFTFTTAMADANYVISAIALNTASANFCYVTAISTTGFTITTGYPVSYGGAFLPGNVTSLMVSVMK